MKTCHKRMKGASWPQEGSNENIRNRSLQNVTFGRCWNVNTTKTTVKAEVIELLPM